MSICALMLGRGGSYGFPNKNMFPVLGRPLMTYPILAAKGSKSIDEIFVSTDSEEIMAEARKHGCRIIVRPEELCTREALGEDAFVHGYWVIRDRLAEQKKEKVELMVLLFANAPTITGEMIDEGVEVLRANPEYDSAVSCSRYNMWSPLRARKIGGDGLLHPAVPHELFGDPQMLNCDRDSQGDVWFADMGVSVVRPKCLANIALGMLPQKWMGQRIYPLKQDGGLDVDFEWQIPMAEFWLKRHGVKEPTPEAEPATA